MVAQKIEHVNTGVLISMSTLGDRLRDELAGKNMSEIARSLGVVRNTLYNWQASGNVPLDQFAALAAHGVDLTYVLTGTRLTGQRKEEADFIHAEGALRVANGQSLLPQTGEALNGIASEERIRAGQITAARALLMNMPRDALSGCLSLVTSYSRLSPDDRSALVRHGAGLEQIANRE